jgi:hypothetical protein
MNLKEAIEIIRNADAEELKTAMAGDASQPDSVSGAAPGYAAIPPESQDEMWCVVERDENGRGGIVYDCLETEELAKAIAEELNLGRGVDAWCWDDDLRERGDYMETRLIARGIIKPHTDKLSYGAEGNR